MEKGIRRNHPPVFKAKVAREALKEQKTVAEIASEYSIHPTQIKSWRDEANTAIEQTFTEKHKRKKKEEEEKANIEEVYKEVGKLQVENAWLKKKMGM